MWDPTATHGVEQDRFGVGSAPDDTLIITGGDDLRGVFATKPCNTHAYLRIRSTKVLDITVCCRFNDIVWGAYGANAVQFSILQEYLAARLDVGVGTHYQFSNNYHIYEDQLTRLTATPSATRDRLWDNRYIQERLKPMPLVHDVKSFDEEVKFLLSTHESILANGGVHGSLRHAIGAKFHNPFLSTTVWPMLMTHRAWKQKDYGRALSWAGTIAAADWRVVATEWVQRRIK